MNILEMIPIVLSDGSEKNSNEIINALNHCGYGVAIGVLLTALDKLEAQGLVVSRRLALQSNRRVWRLVTANAQWGPTP